MLLFFMQPLYYLFMYLYNPIIYSGLLYTAIIVHTISTYLL